MSAPDFSLNGKRALVTGAGRGLGREIAGSLAASGAHVMLVSRNEAELDASVRAIRAEGGTAESASCDICDIPALEALFASSTAFDVVVCNAGTNRPKPIAQISEDDFDAVSSLNLKATYFTAKFASTRMQASGIRGSIINITSQMGHVGATNRTAYCATKHGVEGLTKALAVELAPDGIRVNSVAPTFVETPMTAPFLQDPQFKRSVLEKIKLGRLAEARDVAAAVVYLASPAGAFVTGTSLLVDGGWTAD